jgi:hypothetical protein
MKSTAQNPKSYVRLYWIIWGTIILILITGRMITAIWFPAIAERLRSSMPLIYFIVIMPYVLILSVLEQFRVTDYVKRQHNKHLPLSNIGFFGFVTSNENFGDPVVDILKSNYKRFMLFSIVVIVALPVLACASWYT